MIDLVKSKKGIGVIIAVFAVSLVIITILSTVYIYLTKVGRHQGFIKQVYNSTQVMEEFAKIIRDGYDNYISNDFNCDIGFSPIDIGNLKLCPKDAAATHLKVEYGGKDYYIPLSGLEVTNNILRLRIYSEDWERQKAWAFTNIYRRLESYLNRYLNMELEIPRVSNVWMNSAIAQGKGTSSTTTLHPLQVTDLSIEANLSVACRGNFYRNECVSYCQGPGVACNYCSYTRDHSDCLHLALTECGSSPTLSSLSGCTNLDRSCRDSSNNILDRCRPMLETNPSLTPADLEEERRKVCAYSSNLGNCGSTVGDSSAFIAKTSEMLGDCLTAGGYPKNHCLYYCTIGSVMPKPQGCRQVVNRMINSTPPSCPLPSDPNYISRNHLCVDCDQAGCFELEYCLYGYSDANSPNAPCNTTTGEGMVRQYIKIICDPEDRGVGRCLPPNCESETSGCGSCVGRTRKSPSYSSLSGSDATCNTCCQP